jgi:hypothetical protein
MACFEKVVPMARFKKYFFSRPRIQYKFSSTYSVWDKFTVVVQLCTVDTASTAIILHNNIFILVLEVPYTGTVCNVLEYLCRINTASTSSTSVQLYWYDA